MSEKYNIAVIDSDDASQLNGAFTKILHSGEWRMTHVVESNLGALNELSEDPDCIIAYNNDLSGISKYLSHTSFRSDSSDPGLIILLADQPSQNYIANAIRLGIADVINIQQTSELGFRRSIINVCQKRRLWRNIQSRQRSLKEAHRELQEKNQELMRFYHNVSHELKTPLTSCLEHVSIVHEGIAGTLNEKQSRFLEIAMDSCNQMANCINDLLDTNSLDSGTLTVELQENRIGSLLEEIHKSFSPVCEKAEIDLQVSIEPDLPMVVMDSERIRQVVSNLIGNAMKHTAPDGRITLDAKKQSNRIAVSVKDTGKGIPDEELERIFSPLYQIDPVPENLSTSGLGLGLSICKHILELHGTRINVSSELGIGSTFLFELDAQSTAIH